MTTLRELAGMAPDHSVRDFVEGRAEPPVDVNDDADLVMVSSMPGDDISQHPFIKATQANPYWGKNPQEVFRAVKEGTIPDQDGRKHAMAWLKACEACGEHLFERRG
jgi:hypothetical protein